jgi:mono/diheme cytochrome c family protein
MNEDDVVVSFDFFKSSFLSRLQGASGSAEPSFGDCLRSGPSFPNIPVEDAMPHRLAAFIFATALVFPASAQSPAVKRVPARYTSPASGSDMYLAYCASCHGTKGLGDGSVAEHLKAAVPDLTTLAKQNKGVFPTQRVSQIIQGEGGLKTHGLQDMPVWGPVFRSLNNSQEPVVRMRVTNLTKHIESLQAK